MSVRTISTPDGIVTIEPIASTIRYHEHGAFGDPYTFACVMTRDGDEATLFAAVGTIQLKARRAIVAALRQVGITRVRYERRNAGGPRKFERER